MLGFGKKHDSNASDEVRHNDQVHMSQDDIPQRPWIETALPVFACGAGLFSDGYINNVRLNRSVRFTSVFPNVIR
jgi:hypothetical protein